MGWPLTTVPDECNAWVRLTLNAPQSIVPPVLPGLIFSAPCAFTYMQTSIRNDLRTGRLGDFYRVADMIVMAVGEQNMGRSLGRPFGVAGEFRVAGEKRVDQDDRLAKLD